MPGLEVRSIPVEPSTQKHFIKGPDFAGHPGLAQLFFNHFYEKIYIKFYDLTLLNLNI